MKRLPISMVVLIVFMAFFFNLERIDIGSVNLIDIQSFVYILSTIAVVSIIAIPFMRRRSLPLLLFLWLVFYTIGKLLIPSTQPDWGGIYTYLTIVEVVLSSICVILAYFLGTNVEDFIKAAENITFDDFKRVETIQESREDIQTEIYRSRRFQHPLTVVVVEPRPESLKLILHRTMIDVQKAMMGRYITVSLARALRSQLRRTDVLLEQKERRRFVILTPETNLAGSSVVIERVKRAADELGVEVGCGIAAFPEDALTFDEMLKQAEDRLKTPVIVGTITPPTSNSS